jgi:hypothetical protein
MQDGTFARGAATMTTSQAGAARPFATGPEVGELLPGFTLPDQHGNAVDVHAAREGGRAFLVFVRGTSW